MTAAADLHLSALRRLRRRAAMVPIVSTLLASATAALPLVADAPLLPPLGLLMLLGWRLLRPELWQAWIGLPLGLADDLFSGRPLGTAAALWTAILLMIEAGEDRMTWRDRTGEWLFAAFGCGVAMMGYWAVAWLTGGSAPLRVTMPLLAATILLFPLAQRLCGRLDDWRLRT